MPGFNIMEKSGNLQTVSVCYLPHVPQTLPALSEENEKQQDQSHNVCLGMFYTSLSAPYNEISQSKTVGKRMAPHRIAHLTRI